MKKFLSLFLAVLMVASVVAMVPFTASAAAAPEHIDADEAVEVIATKKQIPIDLSEENKPVATANDGNTAKLFDGKAFYDTTKYEGNVSGSVTFTFQTTEAASVAYYAVYTGNDNASWNGRNPDGWILSASVDGSAYTVIDEVTNTGLEERNSYAYVYAIDNPASYQYYKLEIKKNGFLQLNEFVLFSDEVSPKLDTTPGSLTEGRYQLDTAHFSAGNGSGFLDGNMIFAALPLSRIIGSNDSTYILDNTKVYVNGVEAKFNKSYMGYTHGGISANDGYFYGIVGAGYTQGEETTVTMLIGDKYYATGTFTPELTAHTVVSSETVYYREANRIASKVTFAEDLGLAVGDEMTTQIHDESPIHTFTVTAVEGNTVTFECADFTTTHSLMKCTLPDGTKFSMPIDYTPATETAKGYVQTRENADDPENKFDTRVIIEANEAYLSDFESATMEVIFTVSGGGTKTFTTAITEAYAQVTAGNDVYTASGKCGLFGVAVIGVPMGTSKVAAKVYFNKGLDNEDVLDLGAASLSITSSADVDTVKAMTKYDVANITVIESNDGNALDAGEGPTKLFDGTTNKHGSHTKPTFTVTFTTEDEITISGLIFTIANDTHSAGSSRTYQTWTIYGVNPDGTKDVVAASIDPITIGVSDIEGGVDPDTISNDNREAYTVKGAGAYSTYILEVTAGSGYTQMGEITLYTAD